MRGPVLMTLINRQLASHNRATVLSTIALLSDVYAALSAS